VAEDLQAAYDWLDSPEKHCTNGYFGTSNGGDDWHMETDVLIQRAEQGSVKCACLYGALCIVTKNPNIPTMTRHQQLIEDYATSKYNLEATIVNDKKGYEAARDILAGARRLALRMGRVKHNVG